MRKFDLDFLEDPENLKKKMWRNFRVLFMENHKENKEFNLNVNPHTADNIAPIFYYFIRSERFFKCNALFQKEGISPNFNRGLCLVGGYGVGKSTVMDVFMWMFKELVNPFFRKAKYFRIYSANEVVMEYESCQTPESKKYFFEKMTTGIICFDDIMNERIASNFGKHDIIKEILEERYKNGLVTHLIINYAQGHEGDLEGTLLKLGERYGPRVYDRLFDMFNFIEFKGKSMRGR